MSLRGVMSHGFSLGSNHEIAAVIQATTVLPPAARTAQFRPKRRV